MFRDQGAFEGLYVGQRAAIQRIAGEFEHFQPFGNQALGCCAGARKSADKKRRRQRTAAARDAEKCK